MEVEAALTDGRYAYPNRPDLSQLPFWRCDVCGNFVGCHHKTKDRTRPLGCIPNPEMKKARMHIHKILDPLWKDKKIKRGAIYSMIAENMGWEEYHTAELRTLEDARAVYRCIKGIERQAQK